MIRKRLRISDELLESLSYRVSSCGINLVLQLSFLSYGRAIEIVFHKHRKYLWKCMPGRYNEGAAPSHLGLHPVELSHHLFPTRTLNYELDWPWQPLLPCSL